ncbi:MAG: 5'/3'-nucleotidase SurE [Fimbriimonadaceae bacterium]|nr:5'/3'-nucleotidase SurE [Fimbriimonadaceae bacterium]
MRILITNDDGIRAPGLRALVEVAREFGEVKVVAPDHERSACGHALTMREPLRMKPFPWDGIEAWEVSGVPTDCVNLGRHAAFDDRVDLLLSGINAGPNLGFDITYSGTVGGAMEGTINGIRSIAVSMALFVDGAPIHWETSQAWLREHLGALIAAPLRPLTFLNVNVPSIALPGLRGHRVTVMGQRVYADRVESREDPWGRTYFWQGGSIVEQGELPGTDVDAINQGYVSITPITLDWTDQTGLTDLRRAVGAGA